MNAPIQDHFAVLAALGGGSLGSAAGAAAAVVVGVSRVSGGREQLTCWELRWADEAIG